MKLKPQNEAFLNEPPSYPLDQVMPTEVNNRLYAVALDLKDRGVDEVKAVELVHGRLRDAGWNGTQAASAEKTMMDAFRKGRAVTKAADPADGLRSKVLRSTWYYNLARAGESILYDPESGELLNIDPANLADLLGQEQCKIFRGKRIPAYFRYDPYGPFILKDADVPIVNTYQPPAWKRENFYFGTPIVTQKSCPEIIDSFLDHITGGDARSKEYILDWCTNLLFRRNLTYLTAIGDAGIGKTTLGTIIMKIVGERNSKKVRDQIFKSQFNACLIDTQALYVDEFKITHPEELSRIKDMVNDRIEIEAKSVDSAQAINSASLYLSTNDMTSLQIEANDRRFSIIELTKKPLTGVALLPCYSPWTVESGTKQYHDLTSDGNITDLALYLFGRMIKSNMLIPFRGQHYADVKRASLPDWADTFIFEYAPKQKVGSVFTIKGVQDVILARHPRLSHVPGRKKIEDEIAKKYSEFFTMTKKGGEHVLKIKKSPATDGEA